MPAQLATRLFSSFPRQGCLPRKLPISRSLTLARIESEAHKNGEFMRKRKKRKIQTGKGVGMGLLHGKCPLHEREGKRLILIALIYPANVQFPLFRLVMMHIMRGKRRYVSVNCALKESLRCDWAMCYQDLLSVTGGKGGGEGGSWTRGLMTRLREKRRPCKVSNPWIRFDLGACEDKIFDMVGEI